MELIRVAQAALFCIEQFVFVLTGKLDFFFQPFLKSYIYIYYFGIYQPRVFGDF